MKTVVTIDFDIIMAPSIGLYNDKVPGNSWEELLKDPYFQLLTIDSDHYIKIIRYLLRCIKHLNKEDIHFIEDHGRVVDFVNSPCNLVNIDHHHDCGYEQDGKEKEWPTCANWVGYLHNKGFINGYTWYHNSNSMLEPPTKVPRAEYEFDKIEADDLPLPDELIICLSEPWVPFSYRPLFYALMDICNAFYDTHFEITMGPHQPVEKPQEDNGLK